MKKALAYCFLMTGVVALFAGCAIQNATGPKHAEVSKIIPALEQDQGRIFIYSWRLKFGGIPQPAIKLNNEMIGKAVPGGFFYVDRPVGEYEISTETEVKRTLSFLLDKGQTRYVRLGMSSGFWELHIYPELVEPKKAQEEINSCSYVGAPLGTR